MSLGKRIIRHPVVQSALGRLAAGYLTLVRRTNRFTVEPAEADPWLDGVLAGLTPADKAKVQGALQKTLSN